MENNMTIALIYCGISCVSAFFMFNYARVIFMMTSKYSTDRNVCYSYIAAGFGALFDCLYPLREIAGVVFPSFISYSLTLAYVVCIELTGLYWILYAEKKQNSWFCKTQKRFKLYMLPFFVLIGFTLSTPFTHVYFYFEGNEYMRGPLFGIISILLFLYVLQDGITAFIRSLKKENYVDRHELRRLFIYAIAYLVIQGIQLTLPSVFPYRSVGIMLIFGVFLYQSMLETIGVDALTRINNRYAVDRYLGTMISSNQEFELVILDVDKFKSINDKYGHTEGDKALQYIAEALSKSDLKNCFYARWGGDEFVIVNNDINNSIADAENRINETLKTVLEKNNCKFTVAVSAGYTVCDGTEKSIPNLLDSADEQLYIRKNSKRK